MKRPNTFFLAFFHLTNLFFSLTKPRSGTLTSQRLIKFNGQYEQYSSLKILPEVGPKSRSWFRAIFYYIELSRNYRKEVQLHVFLTILFISLIGPLQFISVLLFWPFSTTMRLYSYSHVPPFYFVISPSYCSLLCIFGLAFPETSSSVYVSLFFNSYFSFSYYLISYFLSYFFCRILIFSTS